MEGVERFREYERSGDSKRAVFDIFDKLRQPKLQLKAVEFSKIVYALAGDRVEEAFGMFETRSATSE